MRTELFPCFCYSHHLAACFPSARTEFLHFYEHVNICWKPRVRKMGWLKNNRQNYLFYYLINTFSLNFNYWLACFPLFLKEEILCIFSDWKRSVGAGSGHLTTGMQGRLGTNYWRNVQTSLTSDQGQGVGRWENMHAGGDKGQRWKHLIFYLPLTHTFFAHKKSPRLSTVWTKIFSERKIDEGKNITESTGDTEGTAGNKIIWTTSICTERERERERER